MLAALTGSGLSAAAGVNAYIPLLMVSLLARFTDHVSLPASYEWLTSWWALSIMAVLLCVELTVDKFPVLDHVNDVIQTVIRPASGGAVMSASAAAAELDGAVGTQLPESDNQAMGWAVGIVIALCVHLAKMLLRPLINAGTAGFGAPVVSAAEDGGSAGLSLAAIFAPILAGIFLLLMVFGIVWLFRARRRRRRRKAEARTAKAAAKAARAARVA